MEAVTNRFSHVHGEGGDSKEGYLSLSAWKGDGAKGNLLALRGSCGGVEPRKGREGGET